MATRGLRSGLFGLAEFCLPSKSNCGQVFIEYELLKVFQVVLSPSVAKKVATVQGTFFKYKFFAHLNGPTLCISQ